jgi:hypothetical protein
MSSTSERFEARIAKDIREAIELGYHPHRFEEMVNSYGAVDTAKRLVRSGDLQDGLKRLRSMGRLDLSMETVMLEEEFSSLFSEQERAAATWRLQQVKGEA